MSENGSQAPTRPTSAMASRPTSGAARRPRGKLDAAALARIETLRHYAINEQTMKTNLMQVAALRANGRHSQNLLRRAMTLDRPIFADGTLRMQSAALQAQTSSSRYISPQPEPQMDDFVNGGSEVLLSKGIVPGIIPGKYSFSGVPETKDWTAAAKRQKELKEALQSLEDEIKFNEMSLLSKTRSTLPDPAAAATSFVQDPNAPTAKFTSVIKSGSHVLGSSFKWRGTQTKSLNVEKFAWPQAYDHSFSSWPVGSTKYGELSHECDVPGGSVYVKKGLGGKKKRR